MPQADIGSKRLVGLAPDAWLQWVTGSPDVVAKAMLNPEFQWVDRAEDILLEAESPGIGRFIVANGIQLRYRSDVHYRVGAYSALAREKYHLPVYAVLVNILPDPSGSIIRDRFESELFGQHALQEYRVINMWEVEAELVFRKPLPPLLPFVPVLKGGGDERMVRRALNALRAEPRLNEMEPLLAFFATFVLESQLVRQIMRWDMAVLRESPWYNEILDTGRRETLHEAVLSNYRVRFGPAPEPLRAAILQIEDIARLEQLHEQAVLAQSPEEFEREMQRESP